MPQFRKKPVIVEARQVSSDTVSEIWDWVGAKEGMIKSVPIPILTEEGTMMAQEGDWVIQGVEGEFYPCKPSVFDATYEAVEGGEMLSETGVPEPDPGVPDPAPAPDEPDTPDQT